MLERRRQTYLGGRRRVRESRSNAGRGNGTLAAAGEGAANGRDNPSRSLPRGPLIKIDPVNWGVWPTLARPQTPLCCILSAFRPPDDRHWSEPFPGFCFVIFFSRFLGDRYVSSIYGERMKIKGFPFVHHHHVRITSAIRVLLRAGRLVFDVHDDLSSTRVFIMAVLSAATMYNSAIKNAREINRRNALFFRANYVRWLSNSISSVPIYVVICV